MFLKISSLKFFMQERLYLLSNLSSSPFIAEELSRVIFHSVIHLHVFFFLHFNQNKCEHSHRFFNFCDFIIWVWCCLDWYIKIDSLRILRHRYSIHFNFVNFVLEPKVTTLSSLLNFKNRSLLSKQICLLLLCCVGQHSTINLSLFTWSLRK